jgi:hypothetical protein
MNTRIAAASLGCVLLAVTAGTAAAAICDNRPGTPITLDAKVTSATSIRFNFRPTTRADEVNKYYDYTVHEVLPSGRQLNVKNQGGVPPHSPHHTSTSYFDINDLKPGSKYCFIVKGRSERGNKGCVSLKWSAPICAQIEGGPKASPTARGPFGAVASDSKGKWGHGLGVTSEAQARSNAQQMCGSGCKVELAGKGTCGAFAESRAANGAYWYGLGLANSPDAASKAALAGCGRGAPKGTCKISKKSCRFTG